MRIDLYQRAEAEGQNSYLMVPAGRRMPEEVVNTDWRDVTRAIELDEEEARQLYAIEHVEQQIADKGYAITSIKNLAHSV